MTIKETYHNFIASLSPLYEEREATSITRIVFEDAFKITNFERTESFEQNELKDEILKRLLTKEPIQYILGEGDFYGLKFKVSPAVLIPRQETEELIYQIIQNNKQQAVSILDIGTGSACIPLTLKKEMPKCQVVGIDVSEAALEIARQNARLLNIEVEFIQKDILTTTTLNQKWDVIVSNPPYIPYEEMKLMPDNVLEYEPHLALFVENEDSLIFYQKITNFAFENLNKNGQLYFECNEYNATEVLKFVEKKGFKNVLLIKDINGKDRIVKGVKL